MLNLKVCVFVTIAVFEQYKAYGGEGEEEGKKATPASILIIIRSQSNDYHQSIAKNKKFNLELEILKHGLKAEVLLMHREWPIERAWLIYPLIPDISKRFSDKYEWVMFVEEYTKVNMRFLASNVLSQHSCNDPVLLGRCLHDDFASPIHHHVHFNGNVTAFKYPDIDAGVVISSALTKLVADEWTAHETLAQFQLDAAHELAMLLNDKHQVKMTCSANFCGSSGQLATCATAVDARNNCGNRITLGDVQFAVKTTEKFHRTRLRAVRKTWGVYPARIAFYSNVTDPAVPTVDCGVPNTATGHCAKTAAILDDVRRKRDRSKWLVIVDDDTILSVARLLQQLSCYESDAVVVLGERYGFALNTTYGFSFIAGGGGLAMSRKAVDGWFSNGCTCPRSDAPDDLMLGQCFTRRVGVPVTHSPRFHQARPLDYSQLVLANRPPISFHKHMDVDPVRVYEEWFREADLLAFSSPVAATLPLAPAPAVTSAARTDSHPGDEL